MAPPTFSSPVRRANKSPTPSTPKSPRTPRSPRALNRVLDGRITKTTKIPPPSVRSIEKHRLSDDHDSSLLLDDIEREQEHLRYEEMMQEKQLFPGSQHWAYDEERLFQILFMRQYSPLLPQHWGMDFRGIPVPDILFATSEEDEPVVYAHSSNGDFKATKAIIRLMDLTASVRAFVQMGKGRQAPSHIKKELDNYLKWAAHDGEYDKLNVLSNMIVEVVDTSKGAEMISPFMHGRMQHLAHRHRTFWRKDQAESEDSDESESGSENGSERRPSQNESRKESQTDDNADVSMLQPAAEANRLEATESVTKTEAVAVESDNPKPAALPGRRDTDKSESQPESSRGDPSGDNDDDAAEEGQDSDVMDLDLGQYEMAPPICYGFFIINRTVMLLTVDPAKGRGAHVSLQVEVSFAKRNQGVWNAMTVAIVVCMARDEMIRRRAYFEVVKDDSDDDPDA